MPETRIGISGWTYAPWRGVFYPEKLPPHGELEFASQQFPTIEINGTFYGLQSPLTFRRWFRATPDDFVFSVKAPRFITHSLSPHPDFTALRHALSGFYNSGVLNLGSKLGPILWQFPAQLVYDERTFAAFADLLESAPSPSLRHVFEVRNETFHDRRFVELLHSKNIALAVSHSPSWPAFAEMTADFLYVKLHGEGRIYTGGYDSRTLHQWAERIRRWKTAGLIPRDVFVYFDNPLEARAPFDAHTFRTLLFDEPQRAPQRL